MTLKRGMVQSPMGAVHYAVSEKGAVAITTPGQDVRELERVLLKRSLSLGNCEPDLDGLHNVGLQLTEYIDGTRRTFCFPLDYMGTPFQVTVWEALRDIPYGETYTYGDVARAIGNPKASRAVGQANHVNPLAIVIP